jgi:hypothetical protein
MGVLLTTKSLRTHRTHGSDVFDRRVVGDVTRSHWQTTLTDESPTSFRGFPRKTQTYKSTTKGFCSRDGTTVLSKGGRLGMAASPE